MMDENFWIGKAKITIREGMKERGLSYRQLALRLRNLGVVITEANLRNKISRGTFPAYFFLQCMAAMQIYTVKF